MIYSATIQKAKETMQYFHYLCNVFENNGFSVKDVCSRYQRMRNINPHFMQPIAYFQKLLTIHHINF